MSIELISLSDVEAAGRRISGRVSNTPFVHSETLSALTGAELWLKFENLQFTGSFKQRGALNTLLLLSKEERERGVIAVSAGNHAQGVAYHASNLNIPSTIVMPVGTPTIKVARTRALGANVLLIGEGFAGASAALPRLIAESGATLIHPFDDDRVIAGQGTVALEMLDARSDLDALVISVGGGGLIAGVATAVRGRSAPIEIIGAESSRFPSMAKAIGRWGGEIEGGSTVAEGIAVAVAGARTRQYVANLVDDIIVVDEGRIEAAIVLLLQIEKTLTEGAGAAGLAAVMSDPERFRGRRVGLVLCGGNIDNRLLTAILRRQQVRDGTLFRLIVHLPDRTGTLGQLCSEIGMMGGNINAVTHDRGFQSVDAKSARVDVEIELADATLRPILENRLREQGFLIEP